MTAPQWVNIIRGIVPKDGVNHNGKPSRIKAKVKKALDKAKIPSETIRGIGRKIGDYAIVYEEKGDTLYATFTDFASLAVQVSKKARKKRSKSKKVPVLLGPHPSVQDLPLKVFVNQITEQFPEEWEFADNTLFRWLAFDAYTMYHSYQTLESSVESIINVAEAALSGKPKVYYTVIEMDKRNILIGIGPA